MGLPLFYIVHGSLSRQSGRYVATADVSIFMRQCPLTIFSPGTFCLNGKNISPAGSRFLRSRERQGDQRLDPVFQRDGMDAESGQSWFSVIFA
jgi:hypothetical protein